MNSITPHENPQLAGVEKVFFVEHRHVRDIADPQHGRIAEALVLTPGREFAALVGTIYTATLNVEGTDTPHGAAYKQLVAGFYAGDSSTVTERLAAMSGRRYLVLLRYFDGSVVAVGDRLSGLLCTANYTTGSKPGDRKGWTWKFEGSTSQAAAYLDAPFSVEEVGDVMPGAPQATVRIVDALGNLVMVISPGDTLQLPNFDPPRYATLLGAARDSEDLANELAAIEARMDNGELATAAAHLLAENAMEEANFALQLQAQKVPLSMLDAPNGLPILNASKQILARFFPDPMLGNMHWGGDYDFGTGLITSPDDELNEASLPAASNDTSGRYFIAVGIGTINGYTYGTGDWIVDYGDVRGYRKVDNTDAVQSVHGRTGAVTTQAADITDSSAAGRALLTAATIHTQRAALQLMLEELAFQPGETGAPLPLDPTSTAWSKVHNFITQLQLATLASLPAGALTPITAAMTLGQMLANLQAQHSSLSSLLQFREAPVPNTTDNRVTFYDNCVFYAKMASNVVLTAAHFNVANAKVGASVRVHVTTTTLANKPVLPANFVVVNGDYMAGYANHLYYITCVGQLGAANGPVMFDVSVCPC